MVNKHLDYTTDEEFLNHLSDSQLLKADSDNGAVTMAPEIVFD
jgi:hypothetical protein